MYNLLISLGAGLLVGAGVYLWLGLAAAVLPGVAAFGVVYFLLARGIMKRLEQVFAGTQKDLSAQRIDRAIKGLEAARGLGRWQFLIQSQIDAQIGMIHYIRGEAKLAQPFLEKSFIRLWITSAMLGCIHHKKKNVEAMRKAFDKSVAVGKKQGLAWSLYGWCEWKQGNTERAIEILSRGDKALKGGDERLRTNLLALKNGKKMKMKSYGDQWYQFHLEKMPVLKQQQVRFARR